MVDDPKPLPYDTVTLRSGAGPYVIADVPADAAGIYELTHPDTDPRYWDWAAIVQLGEIATVTRLTETGPVTWRRP